MKRYAFIYNPVSGRDTSGSRLSKLQEKVAHLGDSKLFYSKGKGHISRLAQQLMDDYDVIVACGGDGTVREAAEPLLNKAVPLGIIPMGSGNDLRKTLGIPRDLDGAFRLLDRHSTIDMDVHSTIDMDVGMCNGRTFLNTLGFGFDGLTNHYTVDFQRLTGTLRYILAALKANIHRRDFDAEIIYDQEHCKKSLLMATLANGRVEGGSFWIAPEASLTDGYLSLVTVDPISKWLLPLVLPFAWLKKLHWIPHYQLHKVKSVELRFSRPVYIHADGENIRTGQQSFEIEIRPAALRVIGNI